MTVEEGFKPEVGVGIEEMRMGRQAGRFSSENSGKVREAQESSSILKGRPTVELQISTRRFPVRGHETS